MANMLDQEVAEKVMGYSLWTNFETGDYEGPYPMWIDGAVYLDEESGDVDHYFEPSVNIEETFQVVEKMRERGCAVTIKSKPDGWEGEAGDWRVDFDGITVKQFLHGCEFGKTLPEAICRAALLALKPREGK